jgi:hypothetical protein
MEGCVTLARIVFVGPVLKNKQKQAKKTSTQMAHGKGALSAARNIGNPRIIALPETKK